MRFVETPVFTSSVRRLLDDEQYRNLQLALVLRPEQGKLIPGAAGLRKLRWRAEGRGKRGGVRTIYYWAVEEHVCYMLYVFAKNEQGDLTPAQAKGSRAWSGRSSSEGSRVQGVADECPTGRRDSPWTSQAVTDGHVQAG